MRLKILLRVSLATFIITSCGVEETHSKKNPEIQELQEQLALAKEDKDFVRAGRLQQEINYKEELLQELTITGRDRIHRKYEVLKRVLEDEILEFDQKDEVHPIHNLHQHAIGMETGDTVYDEPFFSTVYHPLVLREVEKVYKDYGPLYVNVTYDAKGKAGVLQRIAVPDNEIPWSGYWYPFGDNSLYTDVKTMEAVPSSDPEKPPVMQEHIKLSPLAKLDKLFRKRNYVSNIVQEEVDLFKGYRPERWEGYCGARAIAAIVTKEPKAPLVVRGENFSISDQKAILTFSHLHYPYTLYGIIYRGNSDTDGTYQDLKPEALHKLVYSIIGEQKRAFYVDDTAGVQVWNKPLYMYRYKIEQDPKYKFAFLVKAYAHLVKERQKETDLPTTDEDMTIPIYTYRLYVDLNDMNAKKEYRVIASQWTGSSFHDHVDTVSVPILNADPKSHNESLNSNMKHFKRYFQSLFMNSSSSIQ